MGNDSLTEKQKSLHMYFLKSAVDNPNRYALAIGDRKWTYSEIEYYSRCLAQSLLNSTDKLKRVGIFANKSYFAYVGVLATLFSGATYIPLNRMFPAERTISMINQADLDVIIVDSQSFEQLQGIIRNIDKKIVIFAPENSGELLSSHIFYNKNDNIFVNGPLKELPESAPEDIAYLLFTSGSTGIPKGVPISHRNVSSFLEYNIKRYQFNEEDRCTQTFDLTFDLSVFDLFMTWGSGACLYVMQSIELLAPLKFLEKNKITIWFSVPSVISLYRKRNLLKANSLKSLRYSFFCGEALTLSSANAWQVAAPQSVIENLYGPTELTIACSCYRWDPLISPQQCINGVVPIGKIYPHLEHLIIDEELFPASSDKEGELCITGSQMFQGYWKNIEQTQKSIICINGKRYYRTGDVVKKEQDYYLYLRRLDHQTKVQGYRIELGEIESIIRQNTSVIEVAAIPWPIEGGEAQGIVAFVTGNNICAEDISKICKLYLPQYMQPKTIYILDRMPYNANRKIDYNTLRLRLSEVKRFARD